MWESGAGGIGELLLDESTWSRYELNFKAMLVEPGSFWITFHRTDFDHFALMTVGGDGKGSFRYRSGARDEAKQEFPTATARSSWSLVRRPAPGSGSGCPVFPGRTGADPLQGRTPDKRSSRLRYRSAVFSVSRHRHHDPGCRAEDTLGGCTAPAAIDGSDCRHLVGIMASRRK